MRRRWNQLSSPDDNRWTFGTWCLFAGLLAFYGGCLWCITGWGPGWLSMTGTCFRAVFESVPGGRGQVIVALFIGVIVLATPIAITLIPTLATLLWIMRRAKRLQAERDAVNNIAVRGDTHPAAPSRPAD